jgi:hypothetical protein
MSSLLFLLSLDPKLGLSESNIVYDLSLTQTWNSDTQGCEEKKNNPWLVRELRLQKMFVENTLSTSLANFLRSKIPQGHSIPSRDHLRRSLGTHQHLWWDIQYP